MMTDRYNVSINLLEKEETKIRKHRSWIIVAVFVIPVMIVMVVNYMNVREQLSGIERDNKQLKACYSRLLEIPDRSENHPEFQKTLSEKEQIIALIEQDDYSTAEVLEEIKSAVPQGVVLIQWEISPEKVAVKGLAPAYRPAAELLARLRDGSMFEEVELLSGRYNQQLNAVEFELVLNWEEGGS